jgi:glycosyltransferase involved in cell wall biosynthesis
MHTNKKKIAIILPALNEEKALEKLLQEIPEMTLEGKGYDVEIVVIDNNSTDNTAEISQKLGAIVLHETRRGKGRAIRKAFSTVEADYFIMLDSDYTYPPVHAVKMIELLQETEVVSGSRILGKREKGSMPTINYIGNVILSFIASNIYKKKISDLCTGYGGFQSHVVKNMELEKVYGFELETRIYIQVVKKGYSFSEIPVNYRCRIGSRAKLNLIKDGFKIAFSLLRHRKDIA